MSDHITYDANGHAVCFSGPRAVDLFQAATLRSGLGLLAKGIKPGRGWTIKAALERASEYTHKEYKGKADIETARSDLAVFIQIRKLELDQN